MSSTSLVESESDPRLDPPAYISESEWQSESESRSHLPSYTAEAQSGERSLVSSARVRHPNRPTGVYTKRNKGRTINLTLLHQEDGIETPVYGRNATVDGRVTLVSGSDVQLVELLIEGEIKLGIADGGGTNNTFLVRRKILWRQGSSRRRSCPATHLFSVQPFSGIVENTRRRLPPPSFSIAYHGVPGMYADVIYTLSIIVTRSRAVFWNNKHMLTIPIQYHPRNYAPRPILPPTLPFFTALKVAPEEFYQIETVMATRRRSGFSPIICHLFIPSSCIYSITENIPFHLQLTAPRSSLRALSVPPNHVSNASSSRIFSFNTLSNLSPIIRVYLLRQIIVEVRGQKAWRTQVLGEGKLTPMPPPLEMEESRRSSEFEFPNGLDPVESLDWSGEVKVSDDIKVGGFAVRHLLVKDFMTLYLKPPEPSKNPLIELQYAHPIRLVTDPCLQAWDA